jgi:hypothetical protein
MPGVKQIKSTDKDRVTGLQKTIAKNTDILKQMKERQSHEKEFKALTN